MVTVIISGMPAVGKTTIGKALASRFGLAYQCGGDVMRDLAKRRGYGAAGEGWWDSDDGMRLLRERREDHTLDKDVDAIMVEIAKKGDVVITSYTLPWLINADTKIWLSASSEARARRMAARDGVSLEQAMQAVSVRDRENFLLYKRLYAVRLGKDLSVFDFVLNTEEIGSDGVIEIASAIVKHVGRKSPLA